MSTSALQGIVLALFTIALGLATLSLCAASFLAGVQDTANGHEDVQETSMPDWDQWVFSFLSLLGLWAGAGAIGFPLGLVFGPLATFACSVVLFPVLLLSAMEADSFLIPYSPPVLLTLVRHWRTWASFYVITLTMMLLFSAILELGHSVAPYLTALLSGPVAAALILIYARLLGRLAWRASGAQMAPIEQSSGGPGDSSRPAARKRGKRKRLEFPDDLDEATRMLID